MLTDYQPIIPIDAIIFDCDGTLSDIEGIDELAKYNGVGEQVMQLTADAMGHSGMSPELYQQRLDLVLPTAQQITALGHLYFQHRTPDIVPVIQILQALGKSIYIVSAGIYSAVAGFAALLKIDSANIFAVPVFFDAAGNYRDFDRNSPMVYADGKCTVVQQLKKQHPQLAHVGDGLNDYATHDLVARFIGYGGAYYRENIAQLCRYYITAPSMSGLLQLCLTADEVNKLAAEQLEYYRKGMMLLHDSVVQNKPE